MASSFSYIILTALQLYIIVIDSCTDSENNECDYCLSQNDFIYGTYRITAPGLYCVEQHIIFNPIAGNISSPNAPGAWFPTNETSFPGCREQKDGAYALGFFAVISIETSNVTLDINKHKIAYHKYFYLQQRFGTIIEISNQPFLPNAGPADFGSGFKNVENITICNGELGLSSHHAIHSNNASNINITNLSIYDFEVAAIQINGFNNVHLSNLYIGPSLQDVPLTAYYSNARFLLLALRKLLNEIEANNMKIPSVSFSYLDENNALSLYEIHNNLVNAMDLVLRYTMNPHDITEKERQSVLFRQSLDLFKNNYLLPDGSALYGIVLNSFNVAVNGFGESDNDGIRKGDGVTIENVVIRDLKLRVNEVSAMYFDRCTDSESVTLLKGPFGDVLDIKKMIDPHAWQIIDEYGTDSVILNDDIKYIGNPLSDAQIALFLYKDYIGDGSDYGFGSYLSPYFIQWALNRDVSWFNCAAFKCNADIMFHANKGIVALRMDGIENAEMHNVDIIHIENRSPLASFTCGNYTGIHNEGAMSTDIRAVSVTDSDLIVSGANNINDIKSHNGDTVGVALMEYASVVFDDESVLEINDISSATKVSGTQYEHLLHVQHGSLFPNNFQQCNISMDDTSEIELNHDMNYLQENGCTQSDFTDIEIPKICHDRCDAFSILLSDTQYIADSVCLTYDVERLHSTGFCYKDIKHIVLLLCDEDNGRCDEDDLNGLIEAIYDGNGDNLYAWSTTIKQRRGIRINIQVDTSKEFTLCLRDVWNINEEMSHAVSIQRGKRTFVCDEEYIVGLPCIDNNKFMNGAYLYSGHNRKFAGYNVHKHNKYKYHGHRSKYNAMSIAQEETNTAGDGDTLWFIIWSVVIVIPVIICCVVPRIFKLNICNNNKSASYSRANISNDEGEEEINEDTMNEQVNICTIGNEDNSTQYEEVYYDGSKTKTYT